MTKQFTKIKAWVAKDIKKKGLCCANCAGLAVSYVEGTPLCKRCWRLSGK